MTIIKLSYTHQHGWISLTLCWVKEARHKRVYIGQGCKFQKQAKNTYDIRSQIFVTWGVCIVTGKKHKGASRGYDDFFFLIWLPITWERLLWEYSLNSTMMIHVYINKGRGKILQREFYSHYGKNNFFFSEEMRKEYRNSSFEFCFLKRDF